jgi:hypothetical protein
VQLDVLRAVLDGSDEQTRVLHVSGPGGIGKSALLDAYQAMAGAAGCCVVRLDGRDLAATPAGVLAALSDPLLVPVEPEPIGTPGGKRLVLLVDDYDHLDQLDRWWRERLLPRLRSDSLCLLAGPAPLGIAWTSDPAWSPAVRRVALRNLSADEARTYLDRRDVPPARHDDVLGSTHGHPLALALVTDLLGREPDADLAALPSDVVSGLLGRLVAEVPSLAHQRALAVAAVARSTDEDLLRAVIGDPATAHEVFGWLAQLSVVEPGPDGLVPHDLVRDVLDADLRWRDREGYREVFRAVQAHLWSRVRASTGRDRQRAIAGFKFCFQHLRGVVSPVAWGSWGQHYPDVATPADRDAILRLVGWAEGTQGAAIAAHWFGCQPDGFHIIRGPAADLRGLVTLLDLTRAEPEERAADPVAAAAWRYVCSRAPLRPGESVVQCRFVVDAECYQAPSPTLNAVPILALQRQLADPHLAWDVVTLADPDAWEDFFAAADYVRAPGADVVIGGRRFGSFAHDFRVVPVEAMTQRWVERALADDVLVTPATTEPVLLVLAQPDFDVAVRQALRDFHRPDLLARNPLVRTRLVADAGSPDAATLAAVVREAVDALAADPRDDRLHRAVDRTYLRGARTQEAAAAALGLPFSTYRRHLTRGVDRVVHRLWQRELGRAPSEVSTSEHQ